MLSIRIDSFGVSRCDETDFTVQNAEQFVEVPWTTSVTRRFQQLLVQPHVSFDVGAGFRQQSFQDGSGCFLVIAMLGIGG